MESDETMWLKDDVAEALNVNTRTVDRISVSDLPRYNISTGKRPTVRFKKSEVLAYIEKRKVTSG